MKKNNRGEVILTEKEFFNIIPNDSELILELIDLYGGEVTLGEVAEILREKEEYDGDE